MSDEDGNGATPWVQAELVAALFAVDPVGTGVALRGPAGTARERWLACARELLPAAAPMRRLPLHVSDSRLLGGLDLAATLTAGRPIVQRGVLAEADGGVLVIAMAERLPALTAARICATLDCQQVLTMREGVSLRSAARLGVIALDEGIAQDEHAPVSLLDRLAFHFDLSALVAPPRSGAHRMGAQQITKARLLLPTINIDEPGLEALCATAQALGIASPRAPLLALRVARAAAALAGRDRILECDTTLAGRLVLAPRAMRLPTAPPSQEREAAPQQVEGEDSATTPPEPAKDELPTPNAESSPLNDIVLDAVRVAIPARLLSQLLGAGASSRCGAHAPGRAGALQRSKSWGRSVGIKRAAPRPGEPLNVLETLRAAAPWQRLRRGDVQPGAQRPRIAIRPDDFHVTRRQQRAETTTIFAVDASGSSALHRLAEAKGAIELLLEDCYVRRDRVALVAFRGGGAEVLLPPTRSLVRVKRNLAALPGGGATPLAAGIDAGIALGAAILRRGGTPTLVLLTDGHANIALNGNPGRNAAEADAMTSARRARGARFPTLVIDTSPRPQRFAERLAGEMGAAYIALPYADAATLSRAVIAAAPRRD